MPMCQKLHNAVVATEQISYDDLPLQGQAQVTLSCIQLHKKAERIAAVLADKAKLNSGQHVALLFPPGLDLIAAFYGCLYVGK